MKEKCKNCKGYYYDTFMDDTFYCEKYTGHWSKYMEKCPGELNADDEIGL